VKTESACLALARYNDASRWREHHCQAAAGPMEHFAEPITSNTAPALNVLHWTDGGGAGGRLEIAPREPDYPQFLAPIGASTPRSMCAAFGRAASTLQGSAIQANSRKGNQYRDGSDARPPRCLTTSTASYGIPELTKKPQ
jgi:hypothetical protein